MGLSGMREAERGRGFLRYAGWVARVRGGELDGIRGIGVVGVVG